MTLNARRIQFVKVIGSQVGVRLFVAQNVVDDHQDFMGESHDGFLFPTSAGNAVIKGREIIVPGVSDSPRDLSKHGSQIGIARSGGSAQALASTLFVAWAYSCPRGKVLVIPNGALK
jgi:hypothetical protein